MKLIFRLYYLTLKLLYRIGLLCLVLFQAEAQNLCNSESNPNLIPDGFEIEEGNIGCHPFKVSVKNKLNDARDVQYVYYYSGQSASELKNLNPTTDLSNIYFVESGEKYSDYTILQFGKDENGKDFYSCKNVAVRLSNEPKFSYTSCNGNRINITIPLSKENTFDKYQIDWGDGIKEEVINIPSDISRSFNDQRLERTISVEGLFINNTADCNSKVSLNVPMTDGGNYPNIDTLFLNNNKESIEIIFDGLDKDHRLFKREPPNPYNNNQEETTISPGSSILLNQGDSQFCFATFRNSGGCFESSGEVCTTILEFLEVERNYAIISWPTHPTGLNTLFGSNGETQSVNYSLIKEENGIVSRIENVLSPFTDTIECSQNFCYQIETEVSGLPKFGASIGYSSVSISNKICTNTDKIKPQALTDLYITYKDDESKSIYFNDDSSWPIERVKYFLSNGAESLTLDSLSKDESIFNILNEESCFSVFFNDECDNRSEQSPEVCAIELKTTDGFLEWTSNNPFAKGEVARYTLYGQNEKTQQFEIITSFSNETNSYSPNLDLFENAATYKLLATSKTGLESFSNFVSIPKSINLNVPNAFSPNGDQLNDTFEIKGNLNTLQKYELMIFDRLSHEVFRTSNPEEFWDGTYLGEPIPSGIYLYNLKAINKQNEEIHRHGYILLLR